MAISARVEPIDRDVALILAEDLSPEAQSAALAEYAGEQIAQARAQNRAAMGFEPDYEVSVDGRRGAPLVSVKPSGVVVAEFDLLLDVFAWIAQKLETESPKKSGRYSKSHVFFADGAEVDPLGAVPAASEYVFINAQPYARKIERGLSSMAPEGVYHAVAAVAHSRFSNLARIGFAFRSMVGGAVGDWAGRTKMAAPQSIRNRPGKARRDWLTRQPAIIIRVGR
jgi:hypothetical protein